MASLEAAVGVSSPSFYPVYWTSSPKLLKPVKEAHGLKTEALWGALKGACDLDICFSSRCGA